MFDLGKVPGTCWDEVVISFHFSSVVFTLINTIRTRISCFHYHVNPLQPSEEAGEGRSVD